MNRVLILGFYALDAVEPYHQHFSLRNYTLQYPYAVEERISIFLALGLAGVIPAIIIAIYALAIDCIFSHQTAQQGRSRTRYTLKDRLWELNCGVLGLALSQGLAFVITAVLKNATGKPRPDLIDRCRPKAGSEDLPVFGLSNSTICEPLSHAILKDGFRSFPSGHSSGMSLFKGLRVSWIAKIFDQLPLPAFSTCPSIWLENYICLTQGERCGNLLSSWSRHWEPR